VLLSENSISNPLSFRSVPVLLLISALALCGCEAKHARAFKEMTWMCVEPSKQDRITYPDSQNVCLWFVENPRYSELISGRKLCDRLKAHNKAVVRVEFDLSRFPGGNEGFNEISIDGTPIENAGGFGASGNPCGEDPRINMRGSQSTSENSLSRMISPNKSVPN